MDKLQGLRVLRGVVDVGLLSTPEAPVVRGAVVCDKPTARDDSAPGKQGNCANELCTPGDRKRIGRGSDLRAAGGVEPDHVAPCQHHKSQFGLKRGIIEILIGCATEKHCAG